MKIQQTNRKNGGQSSPFNWRWAPLLAIFACLIMAGRATAGTLTVTSTPIAQSGVAAYSYSLSTPVNLTAEGDLDWAKWGRFVASDFDHKAGVTPQIGWSSIPSIGLGVWSTSDANCTWVDGTVDQQCVQYGYGNGMGQGLSGNRGGVSVNGAGNSFTITVPALASPTTHYLHLYVAPYVNPPVPTPATLVFTLSDGTTTTVPMGSVSTRYTVAFNNTAGPGTLTVTYAATGAGNIGLMAATLSSADPLPLGVAQPQFSNGTTLTAGSTYSLQAIAHGVDINGGSAFTYQWQVSYNGGGYVNIPGATNYNYQATAGATGTYNYQVSVTLGANTVTSVPSATLTVTTGTSTLGVSSVAIPANLAPLFLTTNVDLTAEGVTDWAYWGYAGLATYDNKAGIIPNYTPIGSGASVFITSLTSFSWTDATTADTTSSGPTKTTGAALVDNGYELDVPVTTTPELLNVYVSANYAWVHVEASLPDGTLFVDNPQTTLGTIRYSFAVSAASSTTLKVKITSVGRTVQASSIALQAATLAPVPALSVGTLVASPGTSVAVNLPVVVSLNTFDPQGRPTFSYLWQRDSGAGYVNLPDTGRSASFMVGGTPGTESCRVIITSSQGSITSAPVVITRNAGAGVLKTLESITASPTYLSQEGSIDWSSWDYNGTTGNWSHKATGGGAIGDLIPVGVPANQTSSTGHIPFWWTDGTPQTGTVTNWWNRRNANIGTGYELDVAASTTSRIFTIYIRTANAPIHIEAYLDDNSAPMIVQDSSAPNIVDDSPVPASDPGLTGYYGYRIQFAAGNPGAHLIFRIWSKYSGGNFGLFAATLQGLPALAGGTAVCSPANTVAVGSTINLQASAAAGVYPLQYQWQINSGAGYVNIPGATNASQLTTSGTAAVGSVSYQVVVTDSSGSVASTPVAVTVAAPTSTLIGSSVNVLGVNVNLSSEGLIDWSHWGYGGFSGHDVLSPVASQISQYSYIGTWQRSDFNVQTTFGGNTPWSWTNGTPDMTVTGDASMLERQSLLLGWEVTAPASTYEKVFNIYPSVALCALHIEAYLSDNSAPVFMDESFTGPNYTARRYSFRYSSPNAGAILHVRYWALGGGNGSGYATLSSATLTYGAIMKAVPAAGGQVTVTWPVGTLQTAPTVSGPWTPSGSTSPYTFTPTLAQQYFRCQIQ